jgi:hypothetical protein
VIRAGLLCATLAACVAACVDEYDTDVWAVLPAISQPCEALGAARTAFEVQPLDEPPFELAAAPCSDQVGGHDFGGFHVTIERMTAGYHRIDVVITGAGGGLLGKISRPFAAGQPLVVPFARGDLPGWPTATIEVEVPACAAGSPIRSVELAATPAMSAAPTARVQLACTAAPAPVELVVPVGPVSLTGSGAGTDGTVCWSGTLDASAPAATPWIVPLTRSCP